MSGWKMKRIDKQTLLSVIKQLDINLEGYVRRIKLYCVGGTYVAFSTIDYVSKDIDFILSYKDFRAISGIVADVEHKNNVRLDLFPGGELPHFQLLRYEIRAKKLLSLEHVDVYEVGLVDFVLTKAIAGREKDYKDISLVVKDKSSVPKEKLIQRFGEIKIDKGKVGEINKNFQRFIDEFYR